MIQDLVNPENKAQTMKPATHDRERRCPRLGGSVKFGYCLDSGNDTLPCFKICDCWWEYFDVVAFLKNRLSDHDFDRFAPVDRAGPEKEMNK
jgi:hypothetical protein